VLSRQRMQPPDAEILAADPIRGNVVDRYRGRRAASTTPDI
jgi:hypothetical protein